MEIYRIPVFSSLFSKNKVDCISKQPPENLKICQKRNKSQNENFFCQKLQEIKNLLEKI
jgi:hypothetical protein